MSSSVTRGLGLLISVLVTAIPARTARGEAAPSWDPVVGSDLAIPQAVLKNEAQSLTTATTIGLGASKSGYLVAWHDERSTDPNSSSIRAIKLDANGQIIQPEIVIFDPPYPSAPGGCDVAFGTSNYLIVYSSIQAGGIFGTRVSEDGNVLDPTPIVIEPLMPKGNPSVAFDGQTFQVSWVDDILVDPKPVHVARVTSDGSVSPSVIVYDQKGGTPKIACRPGECAVTWFANMDTAEPHDVVVQRFEPNGTPAGSALVVGNTGTPSTGQAWPAIAADPAVYMLAWENQETGPLEAASVSNGVASNLELGLPPFVATDAALASDGNRWLLAFGESGHALSAKTYMNAGVAMSNAVNVATTAPTEPELQLPTLATAVSGNFMIAYARGTEIHTRRIDVPLPDLPTDSGVDSANVVSDAGDRADAGDAQPTGSGSGSGCGCALPGRDQPGSAGLAFGIALLVALERQRRVNRA